MPENPEIWKAVAMQVRILILRIGNISGWSWFLIFDAKFITNGQKWTEVRKCLFQKLISLAIGSGSIQFLITLQNHYFKKKSWWIQKQNEMFIFLNYFEFQVQPLWNFSVRSSVGGDSAGEIDFACPLVYWTILSSFSVVPMVVPHQASADVVALFSLSFSQIIKNSRIK